MAQFVELLIPGERRAYIRCSAIERVETDSSLEASAIAPPDNPVTLVLRDTQKELYVFGCSVLDILHAIHRDDVFLDPRGEIA